MICRKYKDIQYSGGSFRQKLRRSIHSFIRGRVKFQFIASALHQKVKLIAGDSPNISGRIGSTEENQGFSRETKTCETQAGRSTLGRSPCLPEMGTFFKSDVSRRCHSHSIHGIGISTYIWLILMVNVGEYTMHGWYGIGIIRKYLQLIKFRKKTAEDSPPKSFSLDTYHCRKTYCN